MNILSPLNTTVIRGFDSVLPVSLLPDIDFDGLITETVHVVDNTMDTIDTTVDSTTELVATASAEPDAESTSVDVSEVVQEIVDFVSNLPDNTTIADALSEVSDALLTTQSFLSEEQLDALLVEVSELLSTIAPDLSQLSITPILDQGVDILSELIDSVGNLSIDGTSLSGELTVDDLPQSFTLDLSDEIDDFVGDASDFLAGITGSANLSDGQFVGEVVVDDAPYELSLNIMDALTSSLTNLLSTADVMLPFANGAFAVDIDTFLGDIEGTIDFAGGDLDLDLATPFGAVDTSVLFPDDAQFEAPVDIFGASTVELDFAAGVLQTSVFNTPITIPLETFSGELGLTAGMATLTLDEFFPGAAPIETTFEVGPLASEVAIALTEDLSGEIAIDAGEVTGTIMSGLGEFDIAASFDDLLLQASSVIDQTTGSLSLNNGLASIDLTTPFGDLAGTLVLATVDDALASMVSL